MLFGHRFNQAPVRTMSVVALLLPIVDFALIHLNTETKVATAFVYGSLLGEPVLLREADAVPF
jgi:hypothetical protein